MAHKNRITTLLEDVPSWQQYPWALPPALKPNFPEGFEPKENPSLKSGRVVEVFPGDTLLIEVAGEVNINNIG